MINETALRRILYVCTVLILIVFLISVIMILPGLREYNLRHSIPGNTFQFVQVFVFIHLPVAAAFAYSLRISFQKHRNKNGFLVTAGVALIIFSILMRDIAADYLVSPEMRIKAIYMLICCGLDFISGVLAFIARYIRGHLLSVR